MSKTLVVSLVVSASMSGAFQTAMSGTSRTITGLGKTIDDLSGRQKRLRDQMTAMPSVFGSHYESFARRYRELGTTIDNLAAKQKRLQELTGRQSALRSERQELRGRLGEAVAGAVAVGAPTVQSIRRAANFEDQVKDIAITGNLSQKQEGKLGRALRENAIQTNQVQAELASGVAILVANGMTPEEAKSYSKLLGKTATASRGQMEELAQLLFSLNTAFKIKGEAGMQEALDAAAHAGKQGQFELKHMARYFPELGASMASFGATGLGAVKELAMGMQVARKYAGTNEEAARNTANWFSHMTAKTTTENFSKIGIDYRSELMKRMREQNISALQASLQVTDSYIDKVSSGQTVTVREGRGKKTKQVSFRDALAAAQKSGNQAEAKALIERFGLSNLFQDMQTVNFYIAMRQGKEMMRAGMASFNTAEAKGVIDRDFIKRLESSNEQAKKLGIQVAELAIAVGTALLPALKGVVAGIMPLVKTAGYLADRFPRLTGGLVGITTGLMMGRVAVLGAAYAGKMLLSMLVGQQMAATLLSTKLLMLKGVFNGGLIGAIKAATVASRAFLLTTVGTVAAVTLAVGSLAAVIYQLVKHWNTLKQPGLLKDLWDWTRSGFGLGTDVRGDMDNPSDLRKKQMAVQNSGGNMQFSPQITIQGNADKSHVEQALASSQRDFELKYSRMMAQKERLAY